jgi:hypothetical protein
MANRPQVLDYQSKRIARKSHKPWIHLKWLSFPVGAVAIFTSIYAAGMGHGTYVPASLLFPYSMLLAMTEHHIGTVSIVLALCQFPVYGQILGYSFSTIPSRGWKACVWLSAIHILATLVAVPFGSKF